LRGDHVQEFGGGRHALVVQVQQQFARHAQATVDVVGAVQLGVVDQALPTHRGARFFKIHAHHHQQLTGQRVAQRLQAGGILQGGLGVVDRARANHHQQAVVFAAQQAGDVAAGGVDQLGGGIRDGQFVEVGNRGQEFFDFPDTDVVSLALHGAL